MVFQHTKKFPPALKWDLCYHALHWRFSPFEIKAFWNFHNVSLRLYQQIVRTYALMVIGCSEPFRGSLKTSHHVYPASLERYGLKERGGLVCDMAFLE